MQWRIGWAIVCHTLHQYPHSILQGWICLRKILHSMTISCPAYMCFLLLFLVAPVLEFLGCYGKPSHLLSWTLFQGNIDGLLLRGKQLRHGNWLLWAIQTPCYSHQSMAGCTNEASLATSGHLSYTFKIREKKKQQKGTPLWLMLLDMIETNSLNCIVPSGRDKERNKKWNPHISVTWLILINGVKYIWNN